MNNPLPEGAMLIKEVQFTQVAGRHKGKLRPTGWLIYEYEGNRIYRYEDKVNCVDYWFVDDELMRKQIHGKHPAFKDLEKFLAGNIKYDAFYAMFHALDDDIYHPSGWWEKFVAFMASRKPETERYEKLNQRNKDLAKYLAFTYGR